MEQGTKIKASDIRIGTVLNINGGMWIVQKITSTRASVIVDLEGYFATWVGANARQLVFRKTDDLIEVPHPG